MAEYLVVKNFERFQHYKNKGGVPAWIKLHKQLLHDYEFQLLPDATKAHLMLIWLLVSQRNDRRIPNDPSWVARQIGAAGKIDLQILVDKGWLISLDHLSGDTLEHSDESDLEQNRIEENRIEENRSSDFEKFYSKYPRHEARADALKAWKALKPNAELIARIIADLTRYRTTERQFVPLPATYLRGRRWEDTPPSPKPEARYQGSQSRVHEYAVEEVTPEQRTANLKTIREMIRKIG